ncbi:RagB/SusD family nutrient uptake outer membrane protein [Pedobacter gandavensis]|uniref:RagB/SusD family nutrient uptake outer membrane protein n=1 Tax=Pedobacter gandavensis TaxID=2679963 RepID=UPI00292E0C4A|nr:RagB/SusD family nutrient uptake outer membrane protein [Pedobacter gandavensis]
MKTYIIYPIVMICLLAVSSCKKYLDVKPVGKIIPATVGEFDALLDNETIARWNFIDNNLGSSIGFLTDDLQLSDGLGKVLYVGNNHPNLERFYAYTFRQPYKKNSSTDLFWSYGYRNVFYFNNVIDGIESLKSKSSVEEANGKAVIAQALVNRAWWYFNAAMVFGPVYKPGGNNNEKVIPYRTQSDINAPMEELSTQEEMFAKVGKDIRTAIPNIPDHVNWPSRPNKVVAQTLMAYYHLFTQKYDSVAYYANLAWTAASAKGVDAVIYDYNSLSLATPANPVGSLLNSPDGLIRAVNSREMLYYRTPDFGAGSVNGTPSYPSDELIALHDKNNDLRYKWFYLSTAGYKTTFNGTTYDDGQRVQNFRSASNATATQNGKTIMTVGFTYPELLLMRAEAYARTNRLAEAIADVNTLRKYRYKPGTPNLVMGSQDEVITAVLDERRRELAILGLKRFMDLKRFSLDVGKPWNKMKISHQFDGQLYQGMIDSKDFIFPIPNSVIQYNPQWGVPLDNRVW